MPRGWRCDCGHRNTWVQTAGTNCERSKPARQESTSTSKTGKTGIRTGPLWCVYMTFDRQCPIAASWFPRGGDHLPAYCTWHSEVIANPRFNTVEEFARWCARLKGPDELEVLDFLVESPGRLLPPRYCTLYTHHPPGELWDWMESGGALELPPPRACYSPSCQYATVEVTEAQVEKFRAAVRAGGWETAIAMLKGTVRQ